MILTELRQGIAELIAIGGAIEPRIKRPVLDSLFSGKGSLEARSLDYLLQQTYGGAVDLVKLQAARLSRLCDFFLTLYGDGEVILLRAPARINILGEHVDYVSYLPTASLPFGSREHDMLMLCRMSETKLIRGASTLVECRPLQFDLGAERFENADGTSVEERWHSYLFARPTPSPGWDNYVKGSVFYALLKYGERIRGGFDFVVDSNIPSGGGASSSSALIVLAGAAIRLRNQISYAASELAKDSSQAEWFVGTRGGAMDHLTICLAQRQHAIHISYDKSTAEAIALPDEGFRWVTFFSHLADKGREVMLEYNERAAVSRLIIPALIEQWAQTLPEVHDLWESVRTARKTGTRLPLDDLQQLLTNLPETLSLAQLERELPETFRKCSLTFPALVKESFDRPLKIRDRALHHIGEVRRVASAIEILRDRTCRQSGAEEVERPLMRAIGALLDQSHESLCSLYEVCTPEVRELVQTLAADPQVYGARLMGGGFGGNVLALTTEEHLSSVIERVQSTYYGPRGRTGFAEGSIMISTPGAGLAVLNPEDVWRQAVHSFNATWWEAERYRHLISDLLDAFGSHGNHSQIWPVIVAAGKGTRAVSSGLTMPKPLAEVAGIASITRVLHTVKEATLSRRTPIVIVSPEVEGQMRECLSGEDVEFVTQREARGTGDAVLCAFERMSGFDGRALVIWGTQPVIRPQTIRRSLQLAAIFKDYRMIVPTALSKEPYAPLRRDHLGQVCGSRETHLEEAQPPRFGETNIGLFILDSQAMFEALRELKGRYWCADESLYDRPGNELGFPNELITLFARLEGGVLASPIADWREQQGIKSLGDIERCEQFIRELEG
jgi:galactokinase